MILIMLGVECNERTLVRTPVGLISKVPGGVGIFADLWGHIHMGTEAGGKEGELEGLRGWLLRRGEQSPSPFSAGSCVSHSRSSAHPLLRQGSPTASLASLQRSHPSGKLWSQTDPAPQG